LLIKTIKSYKTPQDFLNDTECHLEQKELENNLILGLCNGFLDKSKEYKSCVFINSYDDNEIQATSVKIHSKAIVSGNTQKAEYIKHLAEFYLENKIEFTGVIGEKNSSELFASIIGRKRVGEKELIVHELKKINHLQLSAGELEIANTNDVELLGDWTFNFQEEAKMFPKKTMREILENTQNTIAKGSLFKWVNNNEVVSIAAIVRKTRNVGIIGLVYTPDHFRGKGYATTCVQKLSEYILNSGFSSCGLFTDKSNSTSNSIYRKIGYIPSAEFTDLEFESR